MHKPYTPPALQKVTCHQEGAFRAALTPFILSPFEDLPLQRFIKQALLAVEQQSMLRNIQYHREGFFTLQHYRTDIQAILLPLFIAAKRLLSASPHRFSLEYTAGIVCDLITPRYLQHAVMSLLRDILQHNQTTHIVCNLCTGMITYAGIVPAHTLAVPCKVAALYGGRILCGNNKTILQFPLSTQKIVCPRWQATKTDDLLNNQLSVVSLSLSSLCN